MSKWLHVCSGRLKIKCQWNRKANNYRKSELFYHLWVIKLMFGCNVVKTRYRSKERFWKSDFGGWFWYSLKVVCKQIILNKARTALFLQFRSFSLDSNGNLKTCIHQVMILFFESLCKFVDITDCFDQVLENIYVSTDYLISSDSLSQSVRAHAVKQSVCNQHNILTLSYTNLIRHACH